MKTEKKVLVGFSILGIFIFIIAFFIAQPENNRFVEISRHHHIALSLIQNIQSKTLEAIEESFAYAVSGEANEKEEFLNWNEKFPEKIKELIDFDAAFGSLAEKEKELSKKILLNQKELVKWANKMFMEFKIKRKVSPDTFKNYEMFVDELSQSLEKIIQLRNEEISRNIVFIRNEIISNKERIHVLGALTLIFCLVFGYFLFRHIRREEFNKNETEGLLDSLSKNTLSVMYLKDFDGKYLFINKRYEDVFDLKNENVKGKTDLDIFPKDTADNFMLNDRRVMKTGEPFEGEEVVPHEDGMHTYISIKVPLRDPEGTIYGICGISTDITERKNAEKELEAFASIASHDLQAPLRKISLFGDRLKESAINLDERSREYIQRMQNSASRMSLFIEDMLNFSTISEEKMSVEKIDLQEQLKNISEDLSHMVSSSNAELKFSNLPKIEGNKNQIDQLFINLIVNSLKYKKKYKDPVVNINYRKKENGYYEFLIEDNGIGFEEKYAERIFEPFQRLHNRSEYQGTGLGLTICKKIVSRHKGTLSVKSHPGEGTTFTILLPEKQTNGN